MNEYFCKSQISIRRNESQFVDNQLSTVMGHGSDFCCSVVALQCGVLQVRGAEVHRAAHAHLQHQVRHPPVGAGHGLEPPRHLDVQIILSQVTTPV